MLLVKNHHDITKSDTKYQIYWLSHCNATSSAVGGASLWPGYCCLPLHQAVGSQAGHIKQKCRPFYSLVDLENERIQHFCTCALLSFLLDPI